MRKVLMFLILTSLALPIFVSATGVDINAASLAQLDEIIGVGPAIGQRIIDARPFSSVDDLLRVSGIGEKTLQKIKEQGLACVGCKPTQAISNNQLPISNQAQSSQAQNSLPNAQKSDISNKVEAEKLTASISQSQPANPWFLFFTVLAVTIILAAVVLIIKFKFT